MKQEMAVSTQRVEATPSLEGETEESTLATEPTPASSSAGVQRPQPQKLSESRAIASKMKSEMTSLKATIKYLEDLTATFDPLQADVEKLQNEVKEKSEALTAANASTENYMAIGRKLEEELEKKKKELDSVKIELEILSGENKKLKEKNKESQRKRETAVTEIEKNMRVVKVRSFEGIQIISLLLSL